MADGMGRKRHRILGFLGVVLTLAALVAVGARSLPEWLQSLPFVPIVVSATPWFALVALVGFVFALLDRRVFTALLALVCIGLQVWWQYPFFRPSATLPPAAVQAVAAPRAQAGDAYARVMTCNVFEGKADAAQIVAKVRDERVEVLALQETTDEFVHRLEQAGIGDYLPYFHISSSDGAYGNGLWSATPLSNPVDDEVGSSASFMPAGGVTFGGVASAGGGDATIRFVSVHTTSPVPGVWDQWRRSIDEIGKLRGRTDTRYVLMGDFNATDDHTPMRNLLGDRFTDAAKQAGHGFAFTWPAGATSHFTRVMNRYRFPLFAGIDHVVLDQGIVAGQIEVAGIAGSDHAALLATIAVN